MNYTLKPHVNKRRQPGKKGTHTQAKLQLNVPETMAVLRRASTVYWLEQGTQLNDPLICTKWGRGTLEKFQNERLDIMQSLLNLE